MVFLNHIHIKHLLVAGWKNISLVDIRGYVAFTLWTCGCNLRCPFCHNWRLTEIDYSICKWIPIDVIIEEITASRNLVDYLHVTGGEPLLQYEKLEELFKRVKEIGLKTSLNSNLTLTKYLKPLLEKNTIDHVATDLKIPPEELYGVDVSTARTLWRDFLTSLELISSRDIDLELRIPLYKRLTPSVLTDHIEEIVDRVDTSKTLIVINPITCEPLVSPRNPEWCRDNQGYREHVLLDIVNILKSYGFSRIYVKSIQGFKVE